MAKDEMNLGKLERVETGVLLEVMWYRRLVGCCFFTSPGVHAWVGEVAQILSPIYGAFANCLQAENGAKPPCQSLLNEAYEINRLSSPGVNAWARERHSAVLADFFG